MLRVDRQGKVNKMKPSIRIALTLIVIVVMGIIAFVKIAAKIGTNPTTYLYIWIVVSVILIGMNIWTWLRDKKK
jgi:hypothetical protein